MAVRFSRPNSCRDCSNHRYIADREERQDKDSLHRMRGVGLNSDEVEAAVARTITVAIHRRQPHMSENGMDRPCSCP